MIRNIVIGGFIFNHKPLEFILNNIPDTHFFDPNILNDINSLNDVVTQLHLVVETKAQSNSAQNKINLIGYSMRGLIATHYAYLHPELINKIVLLNSSPTFIENNEWQGIKSADFKKLILRLNKNNTLEFVRYFTQLVNHPEKIDKLNLSEIYSEKINTNTLGVLLSIIGITDIRQKLHTLAHKTLMINSQYDVLVPTNEFSINQVVLINGTHYNLNNNSKYIVNLIHEFMQNA